MIDTSLLFCCVIMNDIVQYLDTEKSNVTHNWVEIHENILNHDVDISSGSYNKDEVKIKKIFLHKIEILAFDDKLVVDSGNNRAKNLEPE